MENFFLKENEKEKLIICFINNFTLGQMEIALAYLKIIKIKDIDKFKDLLLKCYHRNSLQNL